MYSKRFSRLVPEPDSRTAMRSFDMARILPPVGVRARSH
jgi:hypothetical protein